MEVHIGGNSAPAEEAGSLPAIDWNYTNSRLPYISRVITLVYYILEC